MFIKESKNVILYEGFKTIGPMCVLVEMVTRSYAPGEVILKHQICSEKTVRFNLGTFLGVYNRTANSHDSSLISLTIL